MQRTSVLWPNGFIACHANIKSDVSVVPTELREGESIAGEEGSFTVDLCYDQMASKQVTPICNPMFSSWPMNCAFA